MYVRFVQYVQRVLLVTSHRELTIGTEFRLNCMAWWWTISLKNIVMCQYALSTLNNICRYFILPHTLVNRPSNLNFPSPD